MRNKFFPDEEITEAGQTKTLLFRFTVLKTTVRFQN